MKKQNEFEDLKKIIGNSFEENENQRPNTEDLAFDILNAGYRKIPVGGCVLDKEQNENFVGFVLKEKERAGKETAEKFAVRLIQEAFLEEGDFLVISVLAVDDILSEFTMDCKKEM